MAGVATVDGERRIDRPVGATRPRPRGRRIQRRAAITAQVIRRRGASRSYFCGILRVDGGSTIVVAERKSAFPATAEYPAGRRRQPRSTARIKTPTTPSSRGCEWGFEVATYAVGWVPYVGWLSGQIMIFYNFGERIVRKHHVQFRRLALGHAALRRGLGQHRRRIAVDAFVQLGNDEWNFFLPPLPPLPPIPCIFRSPSSLSELDGVRRMMPCSNEESLEMRLS